MTSADDFVIQLLQDKGIVPADALASARGQVKPETPADGMDAATLEVLFANHIVTPELVTATLAAEFHMEVADLHDVRASHDALKLVNKELAKRYKVFPLEVDTKAKTMTLAISDPLDVDAVDSLSKMLGLSITTLLATPKAIQDAISAILRVGGGGAGIRGDFRGGGVEREGDAGDGGGGGGEGERRADHSLCAYVDFGGGEAAGVGHSFGAFGEAVSDPVPD